MADDLSKELTVSESDPIALQERANDEPGSFLDVYRSISMTSTELDAEFVNLSVMSGVVPESIRYGIMRRGDMEAYRGVVKSRDGEFHYFNWSAGVDFSLVKADDATKRWEAEKLFRSCQYGCDMRKSGDAPAATMPVEEDRWIEQQETEMHTVHPGAAQGQTPDDPEDGMNWHAKAITRPGDGAELAHEESQQHWTTAHLVKAWGKQLQDSAPRRVPLATPEESQYMREVLGATDAQISKGLKLPPRHRVAFEQWRTSQLRGNLTNLEAWLKRNRE